MIEELRLGKAIGFYDEIEAAVDEMLSCPKTLAQYQRQCSARMSSGVFDLVEVIKRISRPSGNEEAIDISVRFAVGAGGVLLVVLAGAGCCSAAKHKGGF